MKSSPYTVEQARQIIHEGGTLQTGYKILAAATFMEECENDHRITFEDMLLCLDHGGLIAEFGARCLYVCTGRDGLGWKPAASEDFVLDRGNWERYLRACGALRSQDATGIATQS